MTQDTPPTTWQANSGVLAVLYDSNGNPVSESAALPATIAAGQQTVTASAVPLASQALSRGLTIKAAPANIATIEVGPSGVTTGTGFILNPGDSVSLEVSNASAVFIIGANTSDTVSWAGS